MAKTSSPAEKFPRNAGAWNELAYFAFQRGDLEGAEQDLVRALELEPDNRSICLPGELKRCDDRFTEDSPQRGEGLESSLLARL